MTDQGTQLYAAMVAAERKQRTGEPMTELECAAAAAGMPPARPVAMTIQTANALVTHAPISEEQLRAGMAHFKALAALTAVSGPRFANANRDAINLHDVCVRRLRETIAEAEVRERRHREAMDGLVELGGVE